MTIVNIARNLAVIVLGIVVPIFLLCQAYFGLVSLSADVRFTEQSQDIFYSFLNAKKSIDNANDYAFLSLLNAEHANQRTMINKQVMKIVIMQIGFAVLSVGMMFIILGIKEGGAEGGMNVGSLKIDFKTGSTGLVVFIFGALMATAGGVLKNDYDTVPIPEYAYDEIKPEYEKLIGAFKKCKRNASKVKLDICLKKAIDEGVTDD